MAAVKKPSVYDTVYSHASSTAAEAMETTTKEMTTNVKPKGKPGRKKTVERTVVSISMTAEDKATLLEYSEKNDMPMASVIHKLIQTLKEQA